MNDGLDSIVEEPGERPNTFKYFYRGHWYHKENRPQAGLIRLYRCATRSVVPCPGLLRFNYVTNNIEETPHLHGSSPSGLAVYRLKMALKNEARDARGPASLRRIFDSVCIRFPPEVARLVSFESERSVMNKQMAIYREPISPSLLTFGERLLQLNLEVTEGIYRGVVQGTDNSVALIFASELMINLLETAQSLRMDGTFDVSKHYNY